MQILLFFFRIPFFFRNFACFFGVFCTFGENIFFVTINTLYIIWIKIHGLALP